MANSFNQLAQLKKQLAERAAQEQRRVAAALLERKQQAVLYGPPGTGKSQTIANVIAESIGLGKKVLFVSEKMAALEVVKRRLDMVGLGDAVLELHSHKTHKKAVLAELERTLRCIVNTLFWCMIS